MDEQEREQIRAEAGAIFGGGGQSGSSANNRSTAGRGSGNVQASSSAQDPGGPSSTLFSENDYSRIRHAIGIISGKGGVGKSLVTASVATELCRRGARVGILDADITGPSIPRMFGLAKVRATAFENMMIPPATAGGLKIISTNLVLEHETDPVLWRGPILAGVVKQFWEECAWGDLDYLLIDMPPGTGDVALTVFQSVPLDGVIIVSSPQDLVQMVVGKAVRMAEMMDIPVLGLVENMSYATCPGCGERLELFGKSRLDEMASTFCVDALDRLPLLPSLAEASDTGSFETALPDSFIPLAAEAVIRRAHELDELFGER